MFIAQVLAGAAFVLSWILPNHYAPWTSFWQDFSAAVGLAVLFGIGVFRSASKVFIPWFAIASVCVAIIPLMQWLFGKIFFFGDAFIVFFYLLGFALAVSVPLLAQGTSEEILQPLIHALLVASIASVGFALAQLFSFEFGSIFLMDLRQGDRPYANLAQPNQLATLLLFGIVATLWLFQWRRLGRWSSGLVVVWLCVGLAMTQSRSAWMGMALLVCWLLSVRRRAHLRVSRDAILTMGIGFALLVATWPSLCNWLYLAATRSLADQATIGLRAPLWKAMLDAVTREPWLGYGWNQVSVAQFRVASDHGPLGQWFEHAHNLVLELLLSNGVPVGALIALGLFAWLLRHAVACVNANVGLALGGVLVVGAHAMVEFPLDYAYFLLPIGLLVGVVEQKSPKRLLILMPRAVVIGVSAFSAVLLLLVLFEYANAEQKNRNLRFAMAGFSFGDAIGEAVQLRFLTQLEALPQFAQSRARRDMSNDDLTRMRQIAERYSFPPVLLRYAMASALNKNPREASRVLQNLCHMHPPERCMEAIDAWREMTAAGYPELELVQLPCQKITDVQVPPVTEHRPSR